MKILFLINYDVYACHVLSKLEEHLKLHDVFIIYTHHVKSFESELDALVNHETVAFRNATRFLESYTFSSIPYGSTFDEDVVKINPDVIISIRFGKILKGDIFDIPRLGILNYHSGRLPYYKGVMATFWSMLNGELDYGWTLHYITNARIDSGPIVATQSFPLDYTHSYAENVFMLYPTIAEHLLLLFKSHAIEKKLPAFSQLEEGQYYTFPTQKECYSFKDKHYKLF